MQINDEIRGDWSNIRGTEYHFLYALWLILLNKASSVAFYRGNDLLAHPTPIIVPPSKSTDLLDKSTPPLTLWTKEDDETDIWIQLKATKESWTRSELLAENLLFNFICNAVYSESNGKLWIASLITQGDIRKKEIEEFISEPKDTTNLYTKLTSIIRTTRKHLFKHGFKPENIKVKKLLEIAKKVLLQLSEIKPIPLEVIKADIEKELAFAYQDRETVQNIGNTLLGAMLNDAAGGPEKAHTYNADWVNAAAGVPILNRGLLDKKPILACDESVKRTLSELSYNPSQFVPRSNLENAFERFIESDKTIFVLIGTSGTGKSWTNAHWASETLHNNLRLLISGAELDNNKTLKSLIANKLRPFTSAQWRDEQFLIRLKSIAVNKYEPIILIDDLLPIGEITLYRRDLARLVNDCKEHKIKLVLTCQKQFWDLFKLGDEIPTTDIFDLNNNINLDNKTHLIQNHSKSNDQDTKSNSKQLFPIQFSAKKSKQIFSYLLTNFSPEELEQAILLRLPNSTVRVIASQFRANAFDLLRTPYFFARYFDKYSELLITSQVPPSLDIDELLDWRIQNIIKKVAGELNVAESDLVPAFNSLIESLWLTRSEGLDYGSAVSSVHEILKENSVNFLSSLRAYGLLTTEGKIRFAEPLIGDWLFAQYITFNEREFGKDFISELKPELDFGIVAALIRHEYSDPVVRAEILHDSNENWVSAIATGFAQINKPDWRILGMFTSFITLYEYSKSVNDVHSSLGQLAARDEKCWKWVAEMYLGDHAKTWDRGSYVLASTIEYNPHQVEVAIRARLSRINNINEKWSTDRDKIKKWLMTNSISPLRRIKHASAAKIGKRIIKRYSRLVGSDDIENNRYRDWNFVDALDKGRGRVALFDKTEMTKLLSDLAADSPVIRYRAVESLLEVAIENPESISNEICNRIIFEKDIAILKRLLIVAYHLIDQLPAELTSALKQSEISNFEPNFWQTNGLLLELLGNLATKCPQEIFNILPKNLHHVEKDLQALLGEMYIYAWWRCADEINEAREHFKSINQLDLTLVTDEFHPFAIRTNAIHLFGQMCLDLNISPKSLTGQQRFYPNLDKNFLYVELTEILELNILLLRDHSDFENFKNLLIECVNKSEPSKIHPFNRARQAVFRCGVTCLDLLIRVAFQMQEPLHLLCKLSVGWQQIRAVRELIKLGRTSESVIDFAKQSIIHLEKAGTSQAIEERRHLLAQLALLEENPKQALLDQRKITSNQPFFDSSSNALGLSTLLKEHKDQLLNYFDINITSTDDLPTIYELVEESRTWESHLFARIYSRMLNERSIYTCEARELCEQMMVVIQKQPDSSLREEYEILYQCLSNYFSTGLLTISNSQSFTSNMPESLISKSHTQAIEVLKEVNSAQNKNSVWLDNLIYSRMWWIESDSCELRNSLLLSGTNCCQPYFFPAVRLAFIIAGEYCGIKDPAAKIMKERKDVHYKLMQHFNLLHWENLANYPQDMLEDALSDFRQAAKQYPYDERIGDWLGLILLGANRLSEAEIELNKSLALPTSEGNLKGNTLYNLACIYARQNNEEKCLYYLMESEKFRQLNKDHIRKDRDLELMREKDWFKRLIA